MAHKSNGPFRRSTASGLRRSGQPALMQAQVIEVLIPDEQLKELDGMGGPAGDVAGQLFQHREQYPCAGR